MSIEKPMVHVLADETYSTAEKGSYNSQFDILIINYPH